MKKVFPIFRIKKRNSFNNPFYSRNNRKFSNDLYEINIEDYSNIVFGNNSQNYIGTKLSYKTNIFVKKNKIKVNYKKELKIYS